MAERATIARPYAKAAFAYARENGRVADWARWLRIARQVVSSDEYARLAQGAGVQSSQLDELIASICGTDLDASGSAFLALLAENQRVDYLPEIAQQFDALVSDDQNVAEVEVVSAVALDDAQQQRLAAAMRKRLSLDVRLHVYRRPEADRRCDGAVGRPADRRLAQGQARAARNRTDELRGGKTDPTCPSRPPRSAT